MVSNLVRRVSSCASRIHRSSTRLAAIGVFAVAVGLHAVGIDAQQTTGSLERCADAAAAWWQGEAGVEFEEIEPESAIRLCEFAVHENKDDGDAWAFLARAYDRANQHSEAWTAIEKAVELGSSAGLWQKGVFYEYGKGVEQVFEQARVSYHKAARQGYLPAVGRLLDLRDPNSIELFMTLIFHEDFKVSEYAAYLLGKAAAMTFNLNDSAVVWSLRKLEPLRTIERLEVLLKSGYSGAYEFAIWALATLGDERAVEPLIGLLSHEDSYIQQSAIEALVDLGDERAVEPLIGLLSHEDSDIQQSAIEALVDLGDERAVEPLIGLLSHEDSYIQKSAVRALGKLGDERAVEPLIESAFA